MISDTDTSRILTTVKQGDTPEGPTRLTDAASRIPSGTAKLSAIYVNATY